MRPVFISGCPRSGTTLLGDLLGRHPRHITTPEAIFKVDLMEIFIQYGNTKKAVDEAFNLLKNNFRFLIWETSVNKNDFLNTTGKYTFRSLMEWIVRQYAQQKHSKTELKTWIDHDPGSLNHANALLEHFPEAQFVHVIRDGRAVAASFMNVEWGPTTIRGAAHFWRGSLNKRKKIEARIDKEIIQRIFYENLVKDTTQTLKQLCTALKLDYTDEMVKGGGYKVIPYTRQQHRQVNQEPQSNKAEGWREKLTDRQIENFEYIAGDQLNELGYPLVFKGKARPPSLFKKVWDLVYHKCKKRINRISWKRRKDRAVQRSKKAVKSG